MSEINLQINDREIEILLRAVLEEKRFLSELVHNHKKDKEMKAEFDIVSNLYEKIRFKMRGSK